MTCFTTLFQHSHAGNKENHEKRRPEDLFSGPTSKKRDFRNTKQKYSTTMPGETLHVTSLLTLMIKIRPLENTSERCPGIKTYFFIIQIYHTNYQLYKNVGI
jgi:hypothetical protein